MSGPVVSPPVAEAPVVSLPDVDLLENVKRLAVEAGHAIKAVYESADFSVTFKKDESPLTKADVASNEIIARGLRAISTDLVVSEEGDPALFAAKAPPAFWLVDPLDGTRDFVAKQDTFVVCIALIRDEEPVLGVIYAPVTDELFWATKGGGAFSTAGPLMNSRTETDHLVAVGSRSMPSDRMKELYEMFKVSKVERFGSALKFCRIAQGLYDVYPRFGPMMEWDTAAGQIIAEEAGCKMIDIRTGRRMKYGKPGLENRGFLCSRANLSLDGSLKHLIKT